MTLPSPHAAWRPLTHVACGQPDAGRPVAWRDGRLLTHADWLAEVRAWRQRLAGEAATHWALFTDDSYDFSTQLFGAWLAGKTVVLPGDSQAATLASLASRCGGWLGDLPGAISLGPGAIDEAPCAPLDLQHTHLVVFTSGSSGEPDAIDKRLAQLDAEMHTLQAAFGERIDADGAATVAATVSHQHIYGLLFVVLWSLAAGRPFLARRLDYLEALPTALQGGAGVLVASPAHLRRVPEEATLTQAGGRLRAVFSSGGPLPPEAADECALRLGHSPIEVFGSSETGGIAWRQRAMDGDHWRPLPDIAWRADGEMLEVLSAHLPTPDWTGTADRVRPAAGPRGDDGFVLLGRADRIVKIGEKRVSLTAIERTLVDGGQWVTEARALVLPDVGGGPRVAVVAVPGPAGHDCLALEGRRALGQRLASRLLAQVERVALPRRWRFVPALPVNPQGKVTEAALAALFRTQVHEPPDAQWLERGADAARLRFAPPASHPVFDGHFPGQPILPGVAQLDWALTWARQAFDLPAEFLRIDALKFQQVVHPGAELDLALQWDAPRGVLTLRYTSALGVHASGKVVFAPAVPQEAPGAH